MERPGVLLLIAVATGVGLGLLSAINDQWPWWIQVFNLGTPWVLTAAATGAFARKPAMGATVGLSALLVAVGTYYTAGLALGIREYASTAAESTQVWGAVALVVGPVAGIAGHLVWHGNGTWKALAAGAIAAALWGEAAWVSQRGLQMPWDIAAAGLNGLAEWAALGLVCAGFALAVALPDTMRGRILALATGLAGAGVVALAADTVSRLIRERGL